MFLVSFKCNNCQSQTVQYVKLLIKMLVIYNVSDKNISALIKPQEIMQSLQKTMDNLTVP